MSVRDRPECVGTTHSALIGHHAPRPDVPACRDSSSSARRLGDADGRSIVRFAVTYTAVSVSQVTAYNKTHVSGRGSDGTTSLSTVPRRVTVLRSSGNNVRHATSVATTRSYTCRAGPQSARSATHKGHPCIAVGRPGATRLHIQNPSNPRRIRPVAHAAPTAYAPPLPMPHPGPPHCRLTEVATCGGARPSDGPQTVLAPVAVSFCQNWCVSSMTLMVYSLPTAFSFNPKEFCGLPSMTL